VARAALESAGLRPILFDEFRAAMVWTQQLAIGGIRLMVHEKELEPASTLLTDIDKESTSGTAASRPFSKPWLFLLLAFLSMVVGWPIAGLRMRDSFHRLTALSLTALLTSYFLFSLWMLWLT